MTVEIFLTRGYVARISDEDWPRVSARRWQAQVQPHSAKVYAFAVVRSAGRKLKVYLHRFIVDAPRGLLVDHADGDGLNCVRENLRLATITENNWNQRCYGASGLRGVQQRGARWRARFGDVHLGTFDTAEQAALAYDTAALAEYGSFAWLNFPEHRPPEARSAPRTPVPWAAE